MFLLGFGIYPNLLLHTSFDSRWQEKRTGLMFITSFTHTHGGELKWH